MQDRTYKGVTQQRSTGFLLVANLRLMGWFSRIPYPALHRLQKQKWIASEWKVTENNQRAKFYRLTAAGRRQLASERSRWAQLSGAIAAVLKPKKSGGEA